MVFEMEHIHLRRISEFNWLPTVVCLYFFLLFILINSFECILGPTYWFECMSEDTSMMWIQTWSQLLDLEGHSFSPPSTRPASSPFPLLPPSHSLLPPPPHPLVKFQHIFFVLDAPRWYRYMDAWGRRSLLHGAASESLTSDTIWSSYTTKWDKWH